MKNEANMDEEKHEMVVAGGDATDHEWTEADFLSFGKGNSDADAVKNSTNADATAGNNEVEDQTQKQAEQPYTGRQATNLGQFPTSVAEAAPWQLLLEKEGRSFSHLSQGPPSPPLVVLHNEIVEFCRLMEPQPHEDEERKKLIETVTKLVEETFGSGTDKCKVLVFGSQATGLYLPSSDIDLVVQLPEVSASDNDNQEEDKNGGTDDDNDSNPSKKKRKRNKKKNDDAAESSEEKKSFLAKKQKEHDEMEAFTKDLKQGNAGKLKKEATISASAAHLSVYQQFANTLRRHHLDRSSSDGEDDEKFRLSYLEVVENTRIPVVKFTHAATNLSVDVCFNQKGGPDAAAYMNQTLSEIPALRPLVFVLKYFLACRGMNETYSGGMGSFLLQLLIVSYLQQRRREECNSGKQMSLYNPEVQANLGAMLLEFLELFGIDFNYVTTGISVRFGGYYFPKGASDKAKIFAPQQGKNNNGGPARTFLVAMEHPLETTLDVGRGTYRMGLLQRAFETGFRTLVAHTSDPVIPTASILGTILPPTTEMWTRRNVVLLQRAAAQGNDSASPVAWLGVSGARKEEGNSSSRKEESNNRSCSPNDGNRKSQRTQTRRSRWSSRGDNNS
jgi:DNA polymerase sigma